MVKKIQLQRGNQWERFWPAQINLAMHFDRSKTLKFNILRGLVLGLLDGPLIGRYKNKGECYQLSAARFEGGAMGFSEGKSL